MKPYIDLPEGALEDQELINRVRKVMDDDYSTIPEHGMRIMRLYLRLAQMTYKTSEFKEVVEDGFRTMCTGQFPIEMMVLWLRSLTQKSVALTYHQFPWFQDYVKEYAPLLQIVRQRQEITENV